MNDFMTVAEAAKRLGLNEVRVRQCFEKLPEQDKRLSGTEAHAVRLSAVAEALDLVVAAEETASEGNGQDPLLAYRLEGILCVVFYMLGADWAQKNIEWLKEEPFPLAFLVVLPMAVASAFGAGKVLRRFANWFNNLP